MYYYFSSHCTLFRFGYRGSTLHGWTLGLRPTTIFWAIFFIHCRRHFLHTIHIYILHTYIIRSSYIYLLHSCYLCLFSGMENLILDTFHVFRAKFEKQLVDRYTMNSQQFGFKSIPQAKHF